MLIKNKTLKIEHNF